MTARTGTPFIKRFSEERELTVLILLDISASGAFGTGRQSKLDVMIEAVEREFGTAAEFTRPKGGIFFWMRLPGVDTSALFQAANAEGLQFNPGAEWSTLGADAQDCLRLCFALTTEDEIRAGVAKLAEICRRETGIPARSGNIDHG